MTIFKHILVATDFEASSTHALNLSVEMAQTFGAELSLLHVWELPVYPYMEFMLNSTLINSVEDRALARLNETLEHTKQRSPRARAVLKTGQPWAGILEAVEELKPDLLVMGTHGHRGVNRALLGSVAEKLVRLSPVPVLTVHAATGA